MRRLLDWRGAQPADEPLVFPWFSSLGLSTFQMAGRPLSQRNQDNKTQEDTSQSLEAPSLNAPKNDPSQSSLWRSRGPGGPTHGCAAERRVLAPGSGAARRRDVRDTRWSGSVDLKRRSVMLVGHLVIS